MKTKFALPLLSLLAIMLTLSGIPFFGDRPFYWAGETVGDATKLILGFVLVLAGLACAFKAGALKRPNRTAG